MTKFTKAAFAAQPSLRGIRFLEHATSFRNLQRMGGESDLHLRPRNQIRSPTNMTGGAGDRVYFSIVANRDFPIAAQVTNALLLFDPIAVLGDFSFFVNPDWRQYGAFVDGFSLPKQVFLQKQQTHSWSDAEVVVQGRIPLRKPYLRFIIVSEEDAQRVPPTLLPFVRTAPKLSFLKKE
ncbi:hypothetical protein EBZ80_16970 [bacterium]|nr:hypothetical protein [bacterium]